MENNTYLVQYLRILATIDSLSWTITHIGGPSKRVMKCFIEQSYHEKQIFQCQLNVKYIKYMYSLEWSIHAV